MEETIKLKYPIPGADGKEITELKFSRLKAKHLKAFPENAFEEGFVWGMDKSIPILASVLSLPEESVGEIDLEDFPKVMEGFKSFFEKSQETGKNVSGQ